MAGKMGLYQYTSDDGVTYNIEMDASNAAAQTGVASAPGSKRNLPHGYEPRHVWAVDASDTTGGRTPTHARRKVQLLDPTSTRWVGSLATITLPDFSVTPSVSVIWNIEAYVGERRLNR